VKFVTIRPSITSNEKSSDLDIWRGDSSRPCPRRAAPSAPAGTRFSRSVRRTGADVRHPRRRLVAGHTVTAPSDQHPASVGVAVTSRRRRPLTAADDRRPVDTPTVDRHQRRPTRPARRRRKRREPGCDDVTRDVVDPNRHESHARALYCTHTQHKHKGKQEGLAVARIARDDPSPLPQEIPASSHPTIRVRRCQ